MSSIGETVPMGMKTHREAVTEQVRRLVRDCGMSCYAIAKATGIDESTLSRFLSGERFLSHTALDRLGDYLQIEVTARGPKQTGKAD